MGAELAVHDAGEDATRAQIPHRIGHFLAAEGAVGDLELAAAGATKNEETLRGTDEKLDVGTRCVVGLGSS